MIFNDGNRYEGEIKTGLSHGKGIMYFSNGKKFEGNFKCGLSDMMSFNK